MSEAAVGGQHIVAAELRYGSAKKASPRLTAQLEQVLAALQVLPFEPPADTAYAEIRTRLEAAGAPIGANDLLIAAHAMALGCAVVTDNTREFGRVDGLEVVNWLRWQFCGYHPQPPADAAALEPLSLAVQKD